MPKKVLICDDEPYIIESLSYLVKREGYEVITAEDGEEAFNKAKEILPDLIFLDVMMPKKSGFEVCQQLKKDERTKGIYIVILTARGEESNEKRGKEAEADEYIVKPFSPRKLSAKIHEILG
ncbi:MAG: two-component system response regulator [Deltaproteobacteria bacterium RBG_16_47_11]|nr:MAG: two-component system response regulator [Deltaproteobacteria bacterium RBG_16_47_11]